MINHPNRSKRHLRPRHTPGPWGFTVAENSYSSSGAEPSCWHIHAVNEDTGIAEVSVALTNQLSDRNFDQNVALCLANSRLIASAPDLLLALEKLEASMSAILASDQRRGGPAALVPEWLTEVRAALAKVEGR